MPHDMQAHMKCETLPEAITRGCWAADSFVATSEVLTYFFRAEFRQKALNSWFLYVLPLMIDVWCFGKEKISLSLFKAQFIPE